ncbi:MAG: DUF4838 domain-containing protein [Chthonomonadales bacterium]
MKTLCILAALIPLAMPATAQRLTIVRNGKSHYAILLAPGATPAMRHGAQELQHFLQVMSGAVLPVVEMQPGSAPNQAIVIRTDPALAEEELTIRTVGNSIEIAGGGKRGAMYGCYALLEDVLGCRWFNQRISKIPHRPTITLPPLNIHQKPSFEYREPYYTEAMDRDWAVRNRTNGNFQNLDESVGGRIAYGPFVHTFNSLVPPDEYFDQHPEYFSMINGKRMKGYYQLCLTNPDVLRISIERVKQWIRENPNATIFSVSQNDTGYRCECPNCKAVEKEEGAPSGVVLRFVNAVADAIAKEYPHVLIDTLAYQWTEDPPKITKPRPNVRIRLAPIGACVSHGLDQCSANTHPYHNLLAWSKITNQLYVWHYSTNFANYLQPLPDLDEIARDIPLFHRHGVVGLFYEGDYAPGGGGEMSELKAYLMAKLMWDVNRPAKPIIDEYINGVYGKAAPYIRKWLDVLHEGPRRHNIHAHIYDPPTAQYLSPAVLAEGDRLFDAAEKATAGDAASHAEVERARLALQYVELMRAAPKYEVSGNQYKPTGGGTRGDLARKVIEKIQRYHIGQVREGEPVEQFLERIRNTGASYPVQTLENEALRLDVVPALGGRIVRLIAKQAQVNLMNEADPNRDGYPNVGGYEEYTAGDYRTPGWNEVYTSQEKPGSITVSAHLSNGVRLTRTYSLEGSALRITTTAVNEGSAPVSVTLRAHPEFAIPSGSKAVVAFRNRSGKIVDISIGEKPSEVFLRGPDLPDGSWTLNAAGLAITEHFDPAQTGTALLDASPSDHRVNLELYAKPVTLAPHTSLTFDQLWQIGAAR